MKWEVSGAWKADGAEGSMTVEAPNQRAAEAIAAGRGMLVEQAIPAAAVAAVVIPPAMPVKVQGEAFGLTRKMAVWAIIIGLFCSPMIFGIPLLVWGIVSMCAIDRAYRRDHPVAAAPPPPAPAKPKPVHYPGVKSMTFDEGKP